jgi:lipopolysaccharide/colanic/teichoic acid biosynthesis glycosyltransferase
VVMASLGLLVASPVLALIAVAIKVDSAGPLLFKQVRVGRGGRPFKMWKFRSMVPGADRLAPNVSPISDPRVTRIGSILRKTYLDELPQLVNVLKGDMSMVGPRPETPEFVALYTDEEQEVLRVRPGIVGPSTLAYMNEAELLATSPDPHAYYIRYILHDRVRLDLEYVESRSFTSDLRLLLDQAVAILARR